MRCIKIKIKTIIFFLFLIIFYLIFKPNYHHHTPQPSYYHQPSNYHEPTLPHIISSPCCTNPYEPPLKDNKSYVRRIGLPINIPTSTVDSNYGCVGILTRVGGKEQILPLFGRPLHMGRNNWQYYAMSDKNNNIKLPISNKGKSCTNEYGCDNISNGDIVYVEGYGDTFKATIYENNVPRYIPY